MATAVKDASPRLRTVEEFMATDPTSWEYVTVPKEDPLGHAHASMGLNKMQFHPGHTYHLPKIIADFLRERLTVYARSCVRVLQPKRDVSAENAVGFGSVNSANTQYVDASQIQTT